MMRIVALLLALLAAPPVSATESAHCYTKIMPNFTEFPSHDDILTANNSNPFSKTDIKGHALNTRLNQTRLSGSCDFDISKDIAFWTALYQSEGCSNESPVAQSFRWFWTAGIDELKAKRKEAVQNAPRDSNGLVVMSHIRGFAEFCLFLNRMGAWHLSTEN